MSGNEVRTQTLPFTCLFLRSANLGDIERALDEKTQAYKSYFYNSALIINIQEVDDIPNIAEIRKITDKYIFILVGFSGVNDRNDIKVRIFNAGYPVFNALGARDVPQPQAAAPSASAASATPAQAEPQVKVVTQVVSSCGNTKVVEGNVRSGTEIRAAGCSLLVKGDVSNGAVVYADYDITVLGALRGKALAGVRDENEDAHIVCMNLDAELISIGGIYKPGDAIEPQFRHKAVQISLENNKFKYFDFKEKEK